MRLPSRIQLWLSRIPNSSKRVARMRKQLCRPHTQPSMRQMPSSRHDRHPQHTHPTVSGPHHPPARHHRPVRNHSGHDQHHLEHPTKTLGQRLMDNTRDNTNWTCTKCGATQTTALPAQAVLCRPCTNKTGGRETWMQPTPHTES